MRVFDVTTKYGGKYIIEQDIYDNEDVLLRVKLENPLLFEGIDYYGIKYILDGGEVQYTTKDKCMCEKGYITDVLNDYIRRSKIVRVEVQGHSNYTGYGNHYDNCLLKSVFYLYFRCKEYSGV